MKLYTKNKDLLETGMSIGETFRIVQSMCHHCLNNF